MNKLITITEQIGLTWPGTTRRARSILQQPKNTTRTTITVQVLKNQLQKHGYSYIFFNTRDIVKIAS